MHEINPADAQRIDDRGLFAPLRRADEWPARRGGVCNQNCNQGRACDCVPAVEIEDLEPRRQAIPEGGGIALAAAIAAALAALVLIFR